jgi:hypothetical protein
MVYGLLKTLSMDNENLVQGRMTDISTPGLQQICKQVQYLLNDIFIMIQLHLRTPTQQQQQQQAPINAPNKCATTTPIPRRDMTE